MSKLHTVYAILLAAKAQGRKGLEVFDDPVGKWVPELLPGAEDKEGADAGDEGGAVERIKWEEITIGALARQMGGAGGPCKCFTLSLNFVGSDIIIPVEGRLR